MARAKPIKPEIHSVTFDERDEQSVASLVALIASENKSGTISPTRVLALRAEMHAKLSEVGPASWRHGVTEAISRGKGWRYALAVIRNNPKGAPMPPRPSYGPKKEKFIPDSLRPDAAKLALYARIGKQRSAVLPRTDSLDRLDYTANPYWSAA